DSRLNSKDYFDSNPDASDRTYSSRGAVIEGYRFDQRHFRIFEEGYRAADLTHWLALDVASQALTKAGFGNTSDLPRATTGVVVGNTLAGEFSRANNLRLRWPFVRRIIRDALRRSANEFDSESLMMAIERKFKDPFPETTENSLPG